MEPAAGDAVRVGVAVALRPVEEAHRDAGVVHAEELVDQELAAVAGGEFDAVELAVPVVEPEVVVRLALGVLRGPEPDGHPGVVDPDDLGLDPAGEVLVRERRGQPG